MDGKSIKKWEFAEFLFVSIAGTLLHFVYAWSGNQKLAGYVSAVNESTWEHLKLLFFPVFLFTVIQAVAFHGEWECLWKVKAKAVLLGMGFIVVFFYTYTGVIGKNIEWLNIASFFAAALLVSLYTIRQFQKTKDCQCRKMIWIAVWLFVFALFVRFTYAPPDLGIFKDPLKETEA